LLAVLVVRKEVSALPIVVELDAVETVIGESGGDLVEVVRLLLLAVQVRVSYRY